MSDNTGTTPNPHTVAAQELIATTRAMSQKIPNFVVPASLADRQRIVRAASVPPEFIELSAVAITNSTALVREGADVTKMRDLLAFADAYAPFADELEALALFVRHTVTAARNQAGSEALTTYALARRLAKRPATAHLAPVVETMRRALGAPRRKAKATEPAPAPTTPPAPAPTDAGKK